MSELEPIVTNLDKEIDVDIALKDLEAIDTIKQAQESI